MKLRWLRELRIRSKMNVKGTRKKKKNLKRNVRKKLRNRKILLLPELKKLRLTTRWMRLKYHMQ